MLLDCFGRDNAEALGVRAPEKSALDRLKHFVHCRVRQYFDIFHRLERLHIIHQHLELQVDNVLDLLFGFLLSCGYIALAIKLRFHVFVMPLDDRYDL